MATKMTTKIIKMAHKLGVKKLSVFTLSQL